MVDVRFATALSIPILLLAGRQLRADDSFVCPVTKPLQSASPPPFSESGGKWVGTEKLWTLIDERWGTRFHTDLGFEQRKIVWFSRDFDWKMKKMPLAITGRRLDGPSAPLIFDGASNAFISGKGSFIVSEVTLPTLGCWEITGHYKSQELSQDLTFVVKIGP
jgi:hypothetical protein